MVALVSVYVLFAPEPAGAGSGVPGADKVVHLLLFAALAATTRWCFGGRWPVVLLVASYAVVSEVVQGLLLSTRSGDPLDVVADLVGVLVGWAVAARWPARAPSPERETLHRG